MATVNFSTISKHSFIGSLLRYPLRVLPNFNYSLIPIDNENLNEATELLAIVPRYT